MPLWPWPWPLPLFPLSGTNLGSVPHRRQVTSLLKIPKTLVFFPYVIFLFLIFVYNILDIYEDIMVRSKGDEYYTKKLLRESMSGGRPGH